MESTNFVSASNRATNAIAFLYVNLALELLGGGSTAVRLLSRDSSEPGLGYAAFGAIFLVAAIACAVFFLQWMHRAYANLPALGASRLHFSPGWAVGSFFVPFANLIHPLQAMREIWHHSSDSDPTKRRSAHSWPVPLLGAWWATYLVSNILGNMSLRMTLGQNNMELALNGEWLGVFGSVVRIPAALLLIHIIRKIDAFQTAARSAQQVTAV